jgi:hypothetical protein
MTSRVVFVVKGKDQEEIVARLKETVRETLQDMGKTEEEIEKILATTKVWSEEEINDLIRP